MTKMKVKEQWREEGQASECPGLRSGVVRVGFNGPNLAFCNKCLSVHGYRMLSKCASAAQFPGCSVPLGSIWLGPFWGGQIAQEEPS